MWSLYALFEQLKHASQFVQQADYIMRSWYVRQSLNWNQPQVYHMATPKVNRQLTIITPPHRTRDTRLTCPEKFKIRYSHHLQNCGSWFEADLLVWLSKIDEWIDNGAIDEIKSDASRLASEQRFAPAIKQLDVDEQGNRFECHLICWPNCSLWQKPVRWSLWLALASTGRSCSCRLLCRHCGCPLL